MNNGESSMFGSSVRSYRNLEAAQSPNLVKYLHTQEKIPLESPQKSPLLPRNKSYDAFAFDRPSRDPPAPALPARFYESVENSSSQQRHLAEIAGLQGEVTRLMAGEVGLRAEKELLVREGKRLREEIEYLNEKCAALEAKGEELFKSQSKMAILQREYGKVLVEFESFRSNCRILHGPDHLASLPTRVDPPYEEEEGRRGASRVAPLPASNRFSAKVSQKVSWKRTSAAVSPIHKLDGYRKYSGNKFDDLSLIESKIDRCRDEDIVEERERDYYAEQREQTRTVDLKDLQRVKDYDSSIRALQSELKELRGKNIALYKKGEEFELEKMKLLEAMNELSYEKSKSQSEQKARENELRRELQKTRLELEEGRIKAMELNEYSQSLAEEKKLIALEKAQMEQKLKKFTSKGQKEARQLQEQSKSIAQLKQTLERTQKQFIALKQRWMALSKRQEQLQIENKLHLHQIQERKGVIADLEAQLEKLKSQQDSVRDAVLEEESLLSKTENKIQAKPQLKEESVKSRSIQTEADSSVARIVEQLACLKETHQRLAGEHGAWGYELNKLKSQNLFLNENYLKLSSLYDRSKADNLNLRELSAAWREIEARARAAKQMDSTVDHLWQIKEVEYENLHLVLERLNQSLH